MKKPIVFMLILGMVCIVGRLVYADLNEDSIGYFIAPGVCKGDFDYDGDVDGSDLAIFAADFGRTDCSSDCEGDFDYDGDVDGSDLAIFAADFSRTDCTHLVVVITSPTLSDTGKYTLTGSVLGKAEVISLSYTVNARPPGFVTPVTNPFSVVLTLDKGVNEIVVTAEDITGNKGANQISVTYRPTSENLIDEALANGEIDEETALIYKVYASFGDDRLPLEFQGDDSEVMDLPAIFEVASRFDELSPEAQAILAPFFETPSAAGNWVPVEMSNATKANGKVMVWWDSNYPEDEAKAQAIDQEINDRIWWNLVEHYMQKEPLSDKGLPDNGGDGRLDIYLKRGGTAGGVIPYKLPACKMMPVKIRINPVSNYPLPVVVSHELMHAIQLAYDLKNGCIGDEYWWLAEATAVWVEDFLYHNPPHTEHRGAQYFLNKPDTPLELNNMYGAYLWPYYLWLKDANPYVVRSIWENTEKEDTDSLKANNAAITGGFEERWPEFVKYNCNREPVDLYKQKDDLEAKAKATSDNFVVLVGPDRRIMLDAAVKHLSAKYHYFVFGDDDVRSVAFYNGFTFKLSESENLGVIEFVWEPLEEDQKKGARVQALVRIEGRDWEELDWTDIPVKTFCRELADERVKELIIIFSNSEYEDRTHMIKPQDFDPLLWVSKMGCWRWEGTVNMTRIWRTGDRNVTETMTATTVWEQQGRWPDDSDAGGLGYVYEPVSGRADWQISGVDGECIISGEAKGLSIVPPVGTYLVTNNYAPAGEMHRAFEMQAFAAEEPLMVTEKWSCPDGIVSLPRGMLFVFSVSPFGGGTFGGVLTECTTNKVEDNGTTISATCSFVGDEMTADVTIDLKSQRVSSGVKFPCGAQQEGVINSDF